MPKGKGGSSGGGAKGGKGKGGAEGDGQAKATKGGTSVKVWWLFLFLGHIFIIY